MGHKGCRNIFTCRDCAAKIVTLDVADGLTLPTVPCMVTKGCGGRMESSAYQLPFNSPLRSCPIAFEWRLPEWHQVDSDHARQGGLFLCPAKYLLRECRADGNAVLVWMIAKGHLRILADRGNPSERFKVLLGFPTPPNLDLGQIPRTTDIRLLDLAVDEFGIPQVTREMLEVAQNSDEFRVWYYEGTLR